VGCDDISLKERLASIQAILGEGFGFQSLILGYLQLVAIIILLCYNTHADELPRNHS
jgi:hypothetical protein